MPLATTGGAKRGVSPMEVVHSSVKFSALMAYRERPPDGERSAGLIAHMTPEPLVDPFEDNDMMPP